MPEANISLPTADDSAEGDAERGDDNDAERAGRSVKRVPEHDTGRTIKIDADAESHADTDADTADEGTGTGKDLTGEAQQADEPEELKEEPDYEDEPDDDDEELLPREGRTPREARRIRIAVSGAVMALVVLALALRIGSASSVLTAGFYGITLILSGSALVLSRRGRTKVATLVLLLSFVPIVLAEWMLTSVR